MNSLPTMRLLRGGTAVLACAAGLCQAACGGALYADAGPAPAAGPPGTYEAPPADQAIVEVDTVPPDVESYPSFYIDGGYAYYVDGRWYRRGPHGWGYYRHEPPQLERQRAVISRAPPAQRERPRVEVAPRAEPPRQVDERGRVEVAPRAEPPRQVDERGRVQEARPAEEHERARVEQAPAAGKPGVVEAQPQHGPARAAPPKKAPPPKRDEHEQH